MKVWSVLTNNNMKKLEFRIRVNQVGKPESNAWNEDYQKVVDTTITAESLAEEMITNFNATLRRGELERILLATHVIKSTFQCPECGGYYEQQELDVFGGICEACNFETFD